MREATYLLDIAENAILKPVCLRTGILRLVRENQISTCRSCRGQYWDKEILHKSVPDVICAGGLFVSSGITVYSLLYLQALWLACLSKKASLICEKILDICELAAYDKVVLATGADTFHFSECKKLPLKSRKGQALLCKWPSLLRRPQFSMVGEGHIGLVEDPSLCRLGATYEDEFNAETALGLREKIGLFFPPALRFEVREVSSATRMMPLHGHLPLVEQISEKLWIFAGLGSRGLLYHGLYGKELAEKII
jgi:glycine/D-amino acid oxidase-like deaminating enzyme